MQSKALQYLTQFRLGRAPGGESAVQVVEESRFTFFDVPGISLVPSLLEMVSEQCASTAPVHQVVAGTGAASSPDAGSAAQAAAAAQRAYEKSKQILDMFRPHFDESLAAPPPGKGQAAEAAAGGGTSQFTKAEDALLLNGLKRFGCDSGSWERIRAHVLPTKRASDIKSRYQKLIARHADNNEVKAWKLSLAVSAAGLRYIYSSNEPYTTHERALYCPKEPCIAPRRDLLTVSLSAVWRKPTCWRRACSISARAST